MKTTNDDGRNAKVQKVQKSTTEAFQLFNLTTVAQILSISRAEVERKVSSGELPSIKLGRRRLVSRRALAEYVAWLESGSK